MMLSCTVVVAAGTVAVAVQVVVEVSDLVAMAMVVIHRVLHVIHSGAKAEVVMAGELW